MYAHYLSPQVGQDTILDAIQVKASQQFGHADVALPPSERRHNRYTSITAPYIACRFTVDIYIAFTNKNVLQRQDNTLYMSFKGNLAMC